MADTGLVGALGWIADTVTGSLASAIATLTVAALGFTILQGRLSVKTGGRVILGCFVLFGAPHIAKALMPAPGQTTYAQAVYAAPVETMPIAPPTPPINRDPYAGASLPMQ